MGSFPSECYFDDKKESQKDEAQFSKEEDEDIMMLMVTRMKKIQEKISGIWIQASLHI